MRRRYDPNEYHVVHPVTRQRAVRRLVSSCFALMVVTLLAAAWQPAAAAQPRVYALRVDGVISQLTADHVLRVLDQAEDSQAAALLLELNSPGGVDSATRRITQALLTAKIPVIVYVGPSPGAQALAGAMFITLAGNVAAMHPDARIGAALPAGLTDRANQEERARRTASALQIGLATAEARDRNTATTARLVQEESVIGADEALAGGIIDRISPDVPALLDQVDGAEVRTPAGAATLGTKNARVVWMQMTWRERLLQTITDPNVAYLLFSAGVVLLLVELYARVRLLAGIPGAVALITAVIAFGNLPVSWIGLGLLILAAILFAAELYTQRIGLLGAAGVLVYLLGSFTLYQPVHQSSPFAPAVAVNRWLVVGTVSVFALGLLLFVRTFLRLRREAIAADARALVGRDGIVVESLAPVGVIRVLGQEWSATTGGGVVAEGTEVVVQGIDGGRLRVEPIDVDLTPADGATNHPSNGAGHA